MTPEKPGQHPPRPATREPADSSSPDRRALVEAYENLVRDEKTKREAAAHPSGATALETSQKLFWAMAAVTIVAGSMILMSRPAWFFGPPAAVESPRVREASLRLAIAREAVRVERYRKATGALPSSLEQAGAGPTGLVYTRAGSESFTLAGTAGTIHLTYRSIDTLATFLGDSPEIIRHRGRP